MRDFLSMVLGGVMVMGVLGGTFQNESHAASYPQPESVPESHLNTAKDHPLLGMIYQPAAKKRLTASELLSLAVVADGILLGENHDNPDHHGLQTWMVKGLVWAKQSPHIVFEMIDSEQNPALKQWVSEDGQDLDRLSSMLDWEKSGWPDWSYYAPIAKAAMMGGGSLHAGNVSRTQTRALARNQPEAHDLRQKLNLNTPMDAVFETSLSKTLTESHCNMLPKQAIPAMVLVQRAKDSQMARRMMEVLEKNHKPVLIAGSGHVRKDYAVPEWLDQIMKEEKKDRDFLSIGFIELDPQLTKPEDYIKSFDTSEFPFDIMWFTPSVEREDPCVVFKRQMEKKAQREKQGS